MKKVIYIFIAVCLVTAVFLQGCKKNREKTSGASEDTSVYIANSQSGSALSPEESKTDTDTHGNTSLTSSTENNSSETVSSIKENVSESKNSDSKTSFSESSQGESQFSLVSDIDVFR